jgi:glyoxylase-like metal-dependent hydrolase (beta-lactamase superfamily II)
MNFHRCVRVFAISAGLTVIAGLWAQARITAEVPRSQNSAAAAAYEVYALRYGTLKNFPVAGLVKGEDPKKRLDIALVIWLLKGNGRNVLVDAGFYRDQFVQQWKPVDYVRPSEVIGRVGLKAQDITDVIISHAHWDHADGADLFPRARVWIQKDEFTYYSDPEHQKKTGVFPVDMKMLSTLQGEKHLELIGGDDKMIIPGITVYTGGRHTYASQYVGVNTAKGIVILASDNVYLYENLEKSLPIAATLDAESNLRAQERMKKLAASPDLVIPGHDAAIFVKFPDPGSGVARIA